VLFALYLVLLCYFLFFSEMFGRAGTAQEYRYNLHLFREIARFTTYRHLLGFGTFFVNVYGNILAFMPLGFFLPALCGMRKKGMLVVMCCFLFSLSVEVLQLVSRLGCFDVDDLFLNTCGGLLGYLVYRICYSLAANQSKRKDKVA
jgi:glycopeptide antibiotics resistance protein